MIASIGTLESKIDITVSEFKFFFLAARYHKVFDLLQCIMRHPKCPQEYVQRISDIFEECQMAYVVDANGPPTIYPAVTAQEAAAITTARRTLRAARQGAANRHLQRATELLGERNWAESVHESINAVESVAIGLVKSARTLGDALKQLNGRGDEPNVHPALIASLHKLYGYRGNAPGVGHCCYGRWCDRWSRRGSLASLHLRILLYFHSSVRLGRADD